MCDKETKKILGDMEARLRQVIKEGDDDVYHRMSLLVHKTAPETQEEIKKINQWVTAHEETTEKIMLALFGNKELRIEGMIETNVGMKKVLGKIHMLVWLLTTIFGSGGIIFIANDIFKFF
jgi:hypothetical protein